MAEDSLREVILPEIKNKDEVIGSGDIIFKFVSRIVGRTRTVFLAWITKRKPFCFFMLL